MSETLGFIKWAAEEIKKLYKGGRRKLAIGLAVILVGGGGHGRLRLRQTRVFS